MHEDLPSQDCIVLIITVYSHNIYQKHKNSIKLKNWFPRERVCKAYYMVIHLSVFSCLHLYHIIPYICSYHWEEGEVHCVRMYLLVYCTICVLVRTMTNSFVCPLSCVLFIPF